MHGMEAELEGNGDFKKRFFLYSGAPETDVLHRKREAVLWLLMQLLFPSL